MNKWNKVQHTLSESRQKVFTSTQQTVARVDETRTRPASGSQALTVYSLFSIHRYKIIMQTLDCTLSYLHTIFNHFT